MTTPQPTYNGSPWRSRFLRSPKIGLELAGRSDFAEVGDLATVSLGAKTGCDEWFFLEKSATRAATATRVRVAGLTGWEGEIPKADLLQALRTPKDLDAVANGQRTRLAAIPKKADTYYLAVRPDRVDKIVREYVQYGEEQGIHTRDLVKSNAVGGAWYRQTRARVTSRWALPYNSGYDYGAVDNSVGALLNGRLVGVQPKDGVDPELLGAVLNTTFTTTTRLLEGVATGNEGAFDVGPPAVRVMKVPDPRLIAGAAGEAEVRSAWQAIVADGVLPHAPLAHGTVPALRARLDRAVLSALGLSGGDAAVLLDRVYRSYGRWRAAVEAVEDMMQEHRKALSKRGGARGASPESKAARTVREELQAVPLLLAELATVDDTIELLDPILPRDCTPDQGVLFEEATVLGPDGKPLDLGGEERLALATFMRGLGMSGPLPLPKDKQRCRRVLDEAVKGQLAHREEADRRAESHVSDDLTTKVGRMVHELWLSDSIKALRAAHLPAAEVSADEVSEEDPSLFNAGQLVPPPPMSD